MPLGLVKPGYPVTAEVLFYKADGVTPFPGVSGAKYQIRSPDKSLIASGTGSQDQNNPARWTIQFTIPANAPPTTNDSRYSIRWDIVNNKTSQSYIEAFEVGGIENAELLPDATVAINNLPFNVDILLPHESLNSLSLRILDEQNTIIQTVSGLPTTPSRQIGNQYFYSMAVPQGLSSYAASGLNRYIAYINYSHDNPAVPETMFQPIYVADMKIIQMMDDVRRDVDRIRNADVLPQLRITDLDLIHFLTKGLMRFNAVPPAQVAFGFMNLDQGFTWYVEKYAEIELLRAQYLAEGMTAFNFSGLDASLDIDQTQYIQTMIDGLETDVAQATTVKNHYLRSGGGRGFAYAIGGVRGLVSNFVFRVPNYGVGISGWAPPMLPFL